MKAEEGMKKRWKKGQKKGAWKDEVKGGRTKQKRNYKNKVKKKSLIWSTCGCAANIIHVSRDINLFLFLIFFRISNTHIEIPRRLLDVIQNY